MTTHIDVQEVKTLVEDRQYYLDKGYLYEIANQYAYDHQSVNKRIKEMRYE